MTRSVLATLTAAAALVVLTGCGGGDEPPPADEPSAAPTTTASTVEEPPTQDAPAATYADPQAMVDAVGDQVALAGCGEPAETAYGDLAIGCKVDGEQVYLSTYDDPAVADALSSDLAPGTVLHVGDGWAVQAEQQGTLDALVDALS